MKTILFLLFTAITGCYTSREIEVEMVQAELIRIDTVTRNLDFIKMLTWRDKDDISYVSFAGIDDSYSLGLTMTVMRRR